jgi:hypothetical protein
MVRLPAWHGRPAAASALARRFRSTGFGPVHYKARGVMAVSIAVALFTSAALLFWVQPMVAKMLLPLLGGSPAVWNTCMVFFQATLLAGYGYAHLLTTRLSLRAQRLAHMTLMLATVAALPIALSSAAAHSDPWNSNPFLWLIRDLFLMVVLPFFTVSSSAPLLQSWFSQTRHRSSHDPYFLYTASNIGSAVGLLAYPSLIEPALHLRDQGRLWTAVYVLLIALFALCAALTWTRRGPGSDPSPPPKPAPKAAENGGAREVTWPRRLQWILWAFIPSSLMLGVTTYFTTDIASVPLLWIVPLTLYLLTFTLAFNRRRLIPLPALVRILPISAITLVFVMLAKSDELAWLQITVHLIFFVCAGLAWHTRLADDRPSSWSLTDFYLCISVGGVLGGLFNALLAPMIFSTVVEYPLLIVLACVRWPARAEPALTLRQAWPDLPWAAGVGLLTAGLAVIVPGFDLEPHLRTMIVFGIPVILCYLLSKLRGHGVQFALAIGAVLVGSRFYTVTRGYTLYTERNFFGSLRVTLDHERTMHELYHGTTVHGMQFLDPARQREPLAYFHRSGPCGQAMASFNSRPGLTNVAVIGLGAGTMSCYAETGQHWTYYEIDPAVIRLAQDGRYFTYLRLCTNATINFKVGDARLRLREAASKQFDLLVCDAFGSDAPPLHLLNCEAIQLYLSKLSDHGVLLFHISSRFLDFRPVIANLAAHFNLLALVESDDVISEELLREGKLPSTWVALGRRAEDLGPLAEDPRWRPLEPSPSVGLWTDDYSNILGIFQWQ